MKSLAFLFLIGAAEAAQDSTPPTDEQIRGWVDQLGALYEAQRNDARKKLASAGAAAEGRLVGGLDHADHRVRKGCLELLTSLASPAGVDRACAIFRSKTEDRAVQAAAFEYLKPHGAKAEDLFIEMLDHPEEAYRSGALLTLTSIRSVQSLPKAAALFDRETSKPVKDQVLVLLRTCGEPARPHLVKLLGNGDAAVRQEALSALVSMNTPAEDLVEPVTRLLKMDVTPTILEEAFGVYARAGGKATPHLLEGLRSTSQAVRQKALEAVTAAGTEGALDAVAELYHRETVDAVRERALDYLVGQGLRAEPALIKALESGIPVVRREAIPALGKIKSERVFDRVAALYKSEKDPEVRRACFAYLETVGLRAEAELIAAMNDEELSIRQRAIRALGAAGSAKAIGPLADLLKDDTSPVRIDAIEALAAIGDKAIEHLREGVKAQRVREADAAEVAFLFNQVAVERFFDGMISDDGSSGTWPGQFEGLSKLGRERVMPVLWKMVADPDYVIRSRDPAQAPMDYSAYLQCLALLAIAELGDAESLKRLQGLSFPEGQFQHRERLVALHRMGDREPLGRFVANELKEGRAFIGGDDKRAGFIKLFNAALLQSRAGSREDALKTYVELAEAVVKASHETEYEDFGRALYNIACIHAAAGRKGEAVEALSRAIEGGFKDYDWMHKDKELDPIRGEEGFQKLVPARK